MALTNIEYGSLASSDVMNQNFTYLDNRISSLSSDLTSNVATINSNIATVNSNISSMSDSYDESFQSVNTTLNNTISAFSDSGLYITTYVNGNSWYREYFSDSDKTTRVWLEQGGVSWNPTFLKAFTNSNYTLIVTGQTYQHAVRVTGRTTTSCSFEQWQTADGRTSDVSVFWYACGV